MSDIEIVKEELIWFPLDEVYESRKTVDYDSHILGLSLERIIELVQRRAREDGEWAIANGMVGEDNKNEPKMREMMAFVSDPKNIEQAVTYIRKKNTEAETTVDFICRDLAMASMWAVVARKKRE